MRIVMGGLLVVILAAAAWLLFFAKPARQASGVSGNTTTPTPTSPPQTAPPEQAQDKSPTQGPAQPPTTSTPEKPEPLPTSETQWTPTEQRIFDLTNAERVKAGLHPLQPEDGLHASARAQSADMLDRRFFDHINPSGESPSDRIGRIARRLIGTAGENIWKGTGTSIVSNPDLANVIVQAWMNSPHHRENILRPEYTHLGVGVVIEGDEVRATQNFSEVKSHLKTPLQPGDSPGAQIVFSTSDREPAPRMFDLQPVGKPDAPAHPTPIENARLPSAPGNYRLRFYFPEGKGFSVYDGPRIEVR